MQLEIKKKVMANLYLKIWTLEKKKKKKNNCELWNSEFLKLFFSEFRFFVSVFATFYLIPTSFLWIAIYLTTPTLYLTSFCDSDFILTRKIELWDMKSENLQFFIFYLVAETSFHKYIIQYLYLHILKEVQQILPWCINTK